MEGKNHRSYIKSLNDEELRAEYKKIRAAVKEDKSKKPLLLPFELEISNRRWERAGLGNLNKERYDKLMKKYSK